MANNKLIVEVTADTTEALEKIKEVTEAANEEPLLQIVQLDMDAVPVVLYKGEEIKGKARVSFDWQTHHKSGPYIHIEHVEDSAKCINTKIIQHNHPISEEEVQLMCFGKE